MSEVLEVTREDLPAGSDTVIEKVGTVTVGRSKACTWYTAGGGTKSSVTISNKGKYTLTLVISGAPDQVRDDEGRQLNGIWKLPPQSKKKSEDPRIMAFADFEGRTVRILNNSAESTDAEVIAHTPH
ncbi:MAG TPA: hypothetical protein VEK57_25425 [Thermoanaerobaculia bacterium]|nr:hypothetical protein [Thermoanaerobaculia bacterium]